MDGVKAPARRLRGSFLIGALAVGAALYFAGRTAIWYAGTDLRARRLSNLGRDECQQVLAECRHVLANRGQYKVSNGCLDMSEWPTHIRALAPDAVVVGDSFVRLICVGPSLGDSYGLSAYAEGVSPSTNDRGMWGNRVELIPGLWLCERGSVPPELKKVRPL